MKYIPQQISNLSKNSHECISNNEEITKYRFEYISIKTVLKLFEKKTI